MAKKCVVHGRRFKVLTTASLEHAAQRPFMRHLLHNPTESRFTGWVYKLLRVGLGLVFIYSGAIKLADTAGFAHILASYQLVPPELVDFAALAIPGLEVILGLGLVLEVRGSLAGVTVLLLGFCVVLWLGIVRGLHIDCGCFSTSGIRERNALKWAFYRDLIMLGGIGYLYVWRFAAGHRPHSAARIVFLATQKTKELASWRAG